MKKNVILLTVVVTLVSFCAQSQLILSIGPEVAGPTNDISYRKLGFGGSLEIAKGQAYAGAFTANMQFVTFPNNSGTGYTKSQVGILTIRGGYRTASEMGKFYVGADAGIGFGVQLISGSGFSVGGGPGYLLALGKKQFLDIGAKYNYVKLGNLNCGWIGIKVAIGLNLTEKPKDPERKLWKSR